MTPLATRADLEALRGPDYVAKLLSEAYQPSNTQAEKDALAQARLDAVLASGDALIRMHLDIPDDWLTVSLKARIVLLEFARDEALYLLEAQSRAGTNESDEARAMQRRRDLADMRKRDKWPGEPETQTPLIGEVVASASRFARDKLIGLV